MCGGVCVAEEGVGRVTWKGGPYSGGAGSHGFEVEGAWNG